MHCTISLCPGQDQRKMEQVESLLNVITFVLKNINHGQIDDMDIELLKSFSLSHLVIAENLKSSSEVKRFNPEQKACEGDEVDVYEKDSTHYDEEDTDNALEIDQEINDQNGYENNYDSPNEIEFAQLEFDPKELESEVDTNKSTGAPDQDAEINQEMNDQHEHVNNYDKPDQIEFSQHEFDPNEVNSNEPKDFKEAISGTIGNLNPKKQKHSNKKEKKVLKVNVIVFRCLFCDLDFKEEEEFQNHDSDKHLKEGKFYCVCNEAFDVKRDAVNHFMAVHKEKNIYPCPECSESLFGRKELKKHLKDVHDKSVDKYQCPVCLDEVRHATYDGLRSHMYLVHRTVQFKCDICEIVITSKLGLEKHKMQLHNDEKIKYTCEKCPEAYYAKSPFENHVAKHNGEPTLVCDQCSKKFYTADYLQKHKNTVHRSKDKRFYCTQCEYSTGQKSGFKRHLATVHSDERPFKCNYCDSRFKTRPGMMLHIRIHTGEKPFKCKFCEKTFTQSDHVKRHEAIHEQAYRFECNVCERKFIQGGNYRLHMRKHHDVTDKSD